MQTRCTEFDLRGAACVVMLDCAGQVHDHRSQGGGWTTRLTEQEGGPPNDAIMTGGNVSVVKPISNERDIQVVRDWWIEIAHEEVDRAVPKAIEYGSTDLIEIGRTLAATMHRANLSDAEYAELGVYFYIVGKIARWTDAVKAGRRVSDDTLHDIGVYVRMAQRIRAVGGWPFDPNPPKESF